MEAGPAVPRARRQAAVAALENIRRVREWEDMSESSKRFRECAAQIDAEFHAELRHKAVRPEDLEPDAENACESEDSSDDGYVTANDSFVSVVSDDCESVDEEFEPPAADDANAEASDGEESEECVSETSEVDSDPDAVSDADAAADAATLSETHELAQ